MMNMRYSNTLCFTVLACLLLSWPALAQTTLYVDDDAPDDPGPGDPEVSDFLEDGSATHPFDAIQKGIDASLAGDTVLLLDGTYSGQGNRDLDFGGRAILLCSENGPDHCVIDCQGSMSDPHTGFYFHGGEGLDSIVRGVTVQGASGILTGGIRCESSSPTIDGNVITDGHNYGLGGGIVCVDSNPDITGNTISENLGELGGAVYCDSSSPRIIGNRILDNIAYRGGGVCCMDSSPEISGNTISGNLAWDEQSQGGGIGCWSGSSPLITNNEISGNRAGELGSSSGEGGGVYCGSTTSPRISGNRILDNHVVCAQLDERFSFDGYGAGVLCGANSSPTVANNFIAGNRFVRNYSILALGDGYGAGIACRAGSLPTIINNTIIDNSGVEDVIVFGGGIFCEAPGAEIINCIVRGNLPDQVAGCDGQVTWSNVEGGYAGTGNIDADPLFVAGPDGCYYLSHTATGQAEDSPCVDAGSAPASTICFSGSAGLVCMDELTTRIDGTNDSGLVDMGYHHGSGLTIPCPLTISAEYTCDPVSGTLPFSTTMAVSLANLNAGQSRRFSAVIDLTTGDGHYLPNWRAGFLDLGPGQTKYWSWLQTIPALGPVIGDNLAVLAATDVTPAPYNQPPYPPAGDTDTAECTMTGIAP